MDTSKWGKCQRERLNAGLCLQCGKRPPYAFHRDCTPCLKKKQKRRQLLYDGRLARGLCPVCGDIRRPDDLIYCRACVEKSKQRHVKNHSLKNDRKYARRLRTRRRREGVCTCCGRERDNAKFLECSNCRRHARVNWKARQVRKITPSL